MLSERRSCLRHTVHGPAFASFDGVTGGMILDLSEQGLSMQTTLPLQPERRVQLRLDLPQTDPQAEEYVETTAYIAWADALGRAGVRFSELPPEARKRLDKWLALNDELPSRKAPKVNLDTVHEIQSRGITGIRSDKLQAITFEPEPAAPQPSASASQTVQYEFHSLGTDLNAALRFLSERARTLLRGNGAAIAITERGPMSSKGMLCRASIGSGGPPLGTRVDANSGFSGECVRTGKSLRCDDSETDPRVVAEICRKLGIRSIAAAPIRYERDVVGLLEVFSPNSFAFDEGDLAVLERLAQTAILLMSQTQSRKAATAAAQH
ncbi:MAG TPA: GAF domain-containing protein [Candidatus Solibacter sp.]|nr:GAF domain-containing protein [Candidatus Solibacter sp.]